MSTYQRGIVSNQVRHTRLDMCVCSRREYYVNSFGVCPNEMRLKWHENGKNHVFDKNIVNLNV